MSQHLLEVIHHAEGVVIFRFGDGSPETLNAWVEAMTQVVAEACAHHPARALYLLQDLRALGSPTPETAEAMMRVSRMMPDALIRWTAVLAPPYTLGLIQRMIKRLPRFQFERVQVFMREEAALTWLLSCQEVNAPIRESAS